MKKSAVLIEILFILFTESTGKSFSDQVAILRPGGLSLDAQHLNKSIMLMQRIADQSNPSGLTATIEQILKWFDTKTGTKSNESLNASPRFHFLDQNYPNPFNSRTGIRYQIAGIGSPIHTTLKIYNILGQEIKTLVDELKEPGLYTAQWMGKTNNGVDVSSGIYFYRLSIDRNMVQTRRMMLLR